VSPSTRELLQKLSVGPAFLLLGQASAALDTGMDRLLADAARRAGLKAPLPSLAAVETLDTQARRALYSAMAGTTSAEVPRWLREVARFPWNGIFTSRIDPNIGRAFDTEWRRVVPTSSVTRTRHPRNVSELRVWMLFGGVSLPEEEQPPLDFLEMATRKRASSEALNQLATSFVTPRGVLLIEGYEPNDWLTPEDIFALLAQFAPGQVHLFSASDEILNNAYLKAAIERGYLTAHATSLSLFLSDAESSGRLTRPAVTFSTSAKFIQLRDAPVEISRDTWNSVIATGRPVDRDLLQPYAHASSPIEYQHFRAFLGASEGAPPWKAIASGYNFERDFEDELYKRVRQDLSSARPPGPLVVSGQAATGKSTALCALALKVARTGSAAVLHISRHGDRPNPATIDNFALWAEENGAPATLVAWDGMGEVEEYFSAYRQLRARGRRALIVGSTYFERTQSPRFIVAPATLTQAESDRFLMWLALYGVSTSPTAARFNIDSSFLALLYRLLPETRRGVQRGLSLELRSAEAGMEKQARLKFSEDDKRLGSMADALRRAGIVTELFLPSGRDQAELTELTFAERSTAEQLTSLILVAGRRGLRIPLELVLRILGRDGSTMLVEIIKRFDIIRWSEDESGDQYLGTRTSFEAELLARGDLGGSEAEIGVITTMLSELRPRAGAGGPEVQFFVDLMARIGPQSDEGRRFVPYYLQIVEGFRKLREDAGRTHYRLVLIEANLTREYVQWSQGKGLMSPIERLELLRGVELVLDETLETSDVSGRARLNLLVESASTLGAQIYELSAGDPDSDSEQIRALAKRVVATSLEARASDPENYYPVDVITWVCMRLVERDALPEAEQVDLIADTLASLESVDASELSPKQQAKYDGRWVQFSRFLEDPVLEEEHLERLKLNQDPAAYYLLARREARLAGDSWDRTGAVAGLDLLANAPEAVRGDWRCARLMLDLFWLTRTGSRFMRGEQESLPFAASDWEDCLRMAESVSAASLFDSYRVEYLKGVALFHLGRYRASAATFEELDRTTTSLSSRIIGIYLASSADGRPVKFTGQVRSVMPDGRRGKVWVEELGIEVPFIPYRFSVADPLMRGDPLPEFHIEFNMRGAYAYPVRISGRRSTRADEQPVR
jgi:hypothetical protein